jgi:hypothetical protein
MAQAVCLDLALTQHKLPAVVAAAASWARAGQQIIAATPSMAPEAAAVKAPEHQLVTLWALMLLARKAVGLIAVMPQGKWER